MLENTHYPPAFSALPYRTRNRRSFDVQRLIGLSLRLATNRQQPPRCDSNRHPQSLCPRRVIHACVLPLPAAPFTVFEALFYPGPQTVPAGIGAFRRQIGQHQPRVLMFFAPVAQQCAMQLAFLALKCDSPSLPTSALGRHPVGKRLPVIPAFATKRALVVNAQKRMPFQFDNGFKQPLRLLCLKPCSIQALKPYQQASAHSGAKSVSTNQGS